MARAGDGLLTLPHANKTLEWAEEARNTLQAPVPTTL